MESGVSMTKTALVTIVIGEAYQKLFQRYAAKRFRAYAERCGYDAKIISEKIRDMPDKKLTWQKMCLADLPWLQEYEQVIILDSDILIARDAPPFPVAPAGKILAALDKGAFQVNSGVMAYRPGTEITAIMNETLKDTEPYWDQRALTKVLQGTGRLQPLDPRFHCMFYVRSWWIFPALFRRNWFYHALCSKKKLALIEWLLLGRRR